jgi:Fur family ferric uptake transcriptional regulator
MTNPTDLKNIGLKATLPRLKILEIFQHSPVRHLTAEDVYRNLLHEELDIGLATVYRVLTQFEQAGLLSRSNFESGKAVFELNEGTHHDHLVCIDCGLVEEFYDQEIESRKPSRKSAVSSCRSMHWRCTAPAPRKSARTASIDGHYGRGPDGTQAR